MHSNKLKLSVEKKGNLIGSIKVINKYLSENYYSVKICDKESQAVKLIRYLVLLLTDNFKDCGSLKPVQ